MHRRDHW